MKQYWQFHNEAYKHLSHDKSNKQKSFLHNFKGGFYVIRMKI